MLNGRCVSVMTKSSRPTSYGMAFGPGHNTLGLGQTECFQLGGGQKSSGDQDAEGVLSCVTTSSKTQWKALALFLLENKKGGREKAINLMSVKDRTRMKQEHPERKILTKKRAQQQKSVSLPAYPL